jgi:two-component system phosphate regulon sensor histidine kinase PhoR
VISVTDTGIGIPPASLPHIFERFYRVDKDRSRELGGTGLGLSIVKHIITLHGGRVEARSEFEKGTTIRILLPV